MSSQSKISSLEHRFIQVNRIISHLARRTVWFIWMNSAGHRLSESQARESWQRVVAKNRQRVMTENRRMVQSRPHFITLQTKPPVTKAITRRWEREANQISAKINNNLKNMKCFKNFILCGSYGHEDSAVWRSVSKSLGVSEIMGFTGQELQRPRISDKIMVYEYGRVRAA